MRKRRWGTDRCRRRSLAAVPDKPEPGSRMDRSSSSRWDGNCRRRTRRGTVRSLPDRCRMSRCRCRHHRRRRQGIRRNPWGTWNRIRRPCTVHLRTQVPPLRRSTRPAKPPSARRARHRPSPSANRPAHPPHQLRHSRPVHHQQLAAAATGMPPRRSRARPRKQAASMQRTSACNRRFGKGHEPGYRLP